MRETYLERKDIKKIVENNIDKSANAIQGIIFEELDEYISTNTIRKIKKLIQGYVL